MNDLISRQAALREYQKVCNGIKCGECPFLIKVNTEKGSHLITDCKLEAFLHNIPSAQEQPAEWVQSTKYKGFLTCSACEDCYIEGWSDKEQKWRFCPQCGKRMNGRGCNSP